MKLKKSFCEKACRKGLNIGAIMLLAKSADSVNLTPVSNILQTAQHNFRSAADRLNLSDAMIPDMLCNAEGIKARGYSP